MSRRIIPVLCALAVAVVPATALAQPIQDPPTVTRGSVVVYGDTKYDLQNQADQKSPAGGTAYEKAISGDTKGNLPRAIAPAPDKPSNRVTDVNRVGSLSAQQLAAAYGTTKPTGPAEQFATAYGATAPNARFVPAAAASDSATSDRVSTDDGWQIAALAEAAVLAAFALGAAVFFAGRQNRAPHMGV
jgi:hypothetical protein